MFSFNFDDIRDLLDELQNAFECLEDLVLNTHGEPPVCNEIANSLVDMGKVFGILNRRSCIIATVISKYSQNGGDE